MASWSKSGEKAAAGYEYTVVKGIFLQSESSTRADGFDYATSNFGLIDRAYPTDGDAQVGETHWQRFARYVDYLNAAAVETGSGATYKVLFMGRHGEGDHNVAEAYYGTPAWNCYWAQQDGNANDTAATTPIIWNDAHLTPIGASQATRAHDVWASQLSSQKQPAPQRYYVSPLTRCMQTAQLTFKGLVLPAESPYRPTVKERLREDVSTHTCDRRSTKTSLQAEFPAYNFEDGFVEHDPMWTGTTDEPPAAHDVRSKALLDDVFLTDPSTWISFTSHSGAITSLLRVLGHRPFELSTGQVISVLVRAESVKGGGGQSGGRTGGPSANPKDDAPWTKADTCAAPPVTSIQGQGCVCQPTKAPGAPSF
ncbi:putative phosphoglycerate mutase pmu1 [Sporothrix stenoceras]|uniref:Phosphoglycerate mutase pmu1 n=1 Tax=Sporothrix stenoceras TaxID=5173 RepID=A0ABR3YX88_9PEZI